MDIIVNLATNPTTLSSSRAVYLIGELPVYDKTAIALKLINIIAPVVESILFTHKISDTDVKLLDYICEVNKLIGKLKLYQGKHILEQQAAYLKQPTPFPVTNEYYFYHLCARSAAENLKLLDGYR